VGARRMSASSNASSRLFNPTLAPCRPAGFTTVRHSGPVASMIEASRQAAYTARGAFVAPPRANLSTRVASVEPVASQAPLSATWRCSADC
jgi:hypothetical protein